MLRYPRIPGLEVEGELGHGAHSVVLRGTHNGVRCAVKLPRTRARWTKWIYREAVALARVKHPLLPAVIEVGEVEGLPYLVMELVEGTTLADMLESGPLDERGAIVILRQLVSVLSAVHEAGLVHRDVKPRNIVIEQRSLALKLVDFGFATPMERVGGDTAGTAAYAAPEQLEPPGQVDARADLFAVGRVLLECLTGPLSRNRDPCGVRDLDVRTALASHGVTPGLVEIAVGLLQRRPEDRYPTAAAVERELENLRQGAPILGPGSYERRRPSSRIVGRQAELDRIVAACRDPSGGGGFVLIRGVRGAGKTRLLAAVEMETRRFARSIRVACRPDAPSLSALRAIFDAYCARLLDPSGRGTADDLRAAIANLLPVAQLIAPESIGALQLPSGAALTEVAGAPDSLAEGSAQILVRLAARMGPLVIVVDDAQWMDPASADALLRAAHRAAEGPLGLVLATRPLIGGEALERFLEMKPARAVEVELPRLSDRQVGELVAAYLGDGAVDPALVARLHSMAGGTPLGVIEVLGAFLDAGAVRPRSGEWTFDSFRAEHAVLPQGATALLGRRLIELPDATRRVLKMAAILGSSFDDGLLTRAMQLDTETFGYAMASATRAGLLELDERGGHRFVHDSLRELIVDALGDRERRDLHLRAAAVLDDQKAPSFEQLCATALHYAAGVDGTHRARLYEVSRAAGEAALARFDNETALRFFSQARDTAASLGIELDQAFFRCSGEAHLRLGALDDSLAAFRAALERAKDARTRATVFGRISWVHQTRAEPERAWETLGLAFACLGHRMPVEDLESAASTSMRLLAGRLAKLPRQTVRQVSWQEDVDLLCELHYQNARLGLEYGKPMRVLESTLEAVSLSEHGAAPATRARARAFYAVVLTVLGMRDGGARQMAKAEEISLRVGDAQTIAFCCQLQSVAAAWAGELDRALSLYRDCVDTHGPWLELNEYVYDVTTGDTIQSIRGRAHDAWLWIERAVERLRRTRVRPVVADYLIHRARAALAATGRNVTNDTWLTRQLAAVPPTDAGHAYHRLLSWGPRARYYLETDQVGTEFEALIVAFEAEGHDPRSVHMAVAEYYQVIAHARMHLCIRAPRSGRSLLLPALRRAVADVSACAKIPLFKSHALVAAAYLAWFEKRERKAKKLLAEAEALANQQSCPWVLYAVARARAHMLRDAGKEDAARDQARVAELLAREHGAVTRARWIREEFHLPEATVTSFATSSSRGSSGRSRWQLSTLVQVARAPRPNLKADQQAAAILDELIASLHAERGAIWFEPEPNAKPTIASRHRSSSESALVDASSPRAALLRSVQQGGEPWPPEGETRSSSQEPHGLDPQRTAAVPLFLYEKAVGALCIERGVDDPPLSQDDRALLVLLSHQVPIALEIARLLFEREQLQAALQQANKMEAMGQLAGGLAHDFNNMLMTMKTSLTAAQELAPREPDLAVELEMIGDAIQRASQLTRQLLNFSRNQRLPVAVHDVNQLIAALEPMLRRVAGSQVNIVLALSPTAVFVEVDRGSLDQALVNLVMNARDAMPRGGVVTIATKNVSLAGMDAQQKNVPPGDYLEIELSDSGEGMSQETLCRVFEPFFTTKPAGRGTGLGLAMVYSFARNCGGSVEVSSELGRGTQFRLYLKRAVRPSKSVRPEPTHTTGGASVRVDGPDTILVVDDDDLVRRSIAKILERNGYRVLAASGSVEALAVARQQGRRIGLIILDILMPDLTGPELGKRLYDVNQQAKVLFVSGFSPGSAQVEEAHVTSDMLLQKPFTQNTLLERVRQLMPS